ncbi:MAG: NADAR family protein [Candidatus Brocadiae bacterium]|nr:NADAR family protein [Candidatus Brocadiia bacterium]
MKDTRSVQDLVQAVNQGMIPSFVFFWGHTPSMPGVIDSSCLSNWYPASFKVDGIEYPTTEHYMMAQKARLFQDSLHEKKIMQAKTPAQAKSLGRKVMGFTTEIWEKHRFEIVVAGNVEKFSQNTELKYFLLGTNPHVLVEASPYDSIWGIGMDKDNKKATKPSQWKGLNLLGFALMEVRGRL